MSISKIVEDSKEVNQIIEALQELSQLRYYFYNEKLDDFGSKDFYKKNKKNVLETFNIVAQNIQNILNTEISASSDGGPADTVESEIDADEIVKAVVEKVKTGGTELDIADYTRIKGEELPFEQHLKKLSVTQFYLLINIFEVDDNTVRVFLENKQVSETMKKKFKNYLSREEFSYHTYRQYEDFEDCGMVLSSHFDEIFPVDYNIMVAQVISDNLSALYSLIDNRPEFIKTVNTLCKEKIFGGEVFKSFIDYQVNMDTDNKNEDFYVLGSNEIPEWGQDIDIIVEKIAGDIYDSYRIVQFKQSSEKPTRKSVAEVLENDKLVKLYVSNIVRVLKELEQERLSFYENKKDNVKKAFNSIALNINLILKSEFDKPSYGSPTIGSSYDVDEILTAILDNIKSEGLKLASADYVKINRNDMSYDADLKKLNDLQFYILFNIMNIDYSFVPEFLRKNKVLNSMKERFYKCYDMNELSCSISKVIEESKDSKDGGVIQNKTGFQINIFSIVGDVIAENKLEFIKDFTDSNQEEICNNVIQKIKPLLLNDFAGFDDMQAKSKNWKERKKEDFCDHFLENALKKPISNVIISIQQQFDKNMSSLKSDYYKRIAVPGTNKTFGEDNVITMYYNPRTGLPSSFNMGRDVDSTRVKRRIDQVEPDTEPTSFFNSAKKAKHSVEKRHK